MHLMFVSPIIGGTIYLSRPIQGFIGKTVIVVLMRVDLEWSARTVINQSTKQTQSIGARRPSPRLGRPLVRAQRAASRLSVTYRSWLILSSSSVQENNVHDKVLPSCQQAEKYVEAGGAGQSRPDEPRGRHEGKKEWNRVDRVQRKWLAREARQVHHTAHRCAWLTR